MTTAMAMADRGISTVTPAIRELTLEEIDWVSGSGAADAAADGAIGGFGVGFTFGAVRAVQLGATIARAALIGIGVGSGVGLAAAVLTTVAFVAVDYLVGND